jgi:hypothetical protein
LNCARQAEEVDGCELIVDGGTTDGFPATIIFHDQPTPHFSVKEKDEASLVRQSHGIRNDAFIPF